ncbi:SMI1/KNR4 family protein [Paenibacillus pinisoli]|uniref:SMI1/KNR4 family protein n=1 Tax=Paenibacillus pinisoli TaxID=1276110 RepID=A0A3A6PG98_9BACL|nr:SMI1/KNR4 family protein [Paenibacillus pinisoli]RJX39915.1 SMI1/KNR4 family protein [Paenibacillus pinisoli]
MPFSFWKKKTGAADRIKIKLEEAKRKDKALSVFGASSHKYNVSQQLDANVLSEWEAKHGVALPEPYKRFLTEVGNGGAGPYYGIYSIEKAASYTESHALAASCVLYPGMAKEEWNQLIEPLTSDEDISDEEYDAARDRVLGGMLCIGTQGCEYDMYLVLNGEYRGRVVYTSDFHPDYPFFFVYEDSFLDWYERWLDEIILDYEISWFGSTMPGDEHALIQVYQSASNEDTRFKALKGMFKLKKISKPTIDFLRNVAEEGQHCRVIAIQLICKTSFGAGRGLLLELLHSESDEDFLKAVQFLNWYGKSYDLTEFKTIISQRLDKVRDPEALRYAGYVMGD